MSAFIAWFGSTVCTPWPDAPALMATIASPASARRRPRAVRVNANIPMVPDPILVPLRRSRAQRTACQQNPWLRGKKLTREEAGPFYDGANPPPPSAHRLLPFLRAAIGPARRCDPETWVSG